MEEKMKTRITTFFMICLAGVLFYTTASAGSGSVRLDPTMTFRMPNKAICLALSQAIQKDKKQLQSVLSYLHEYGCYSGPSASSPQCVSLRNKRAALEARIASNQARARRNGCM